MAEQTTQQQKQPQPERKHLVRIANTDLNGNKSIVYALRSIKGVGISFANAVCRLAGVNPCTKAGDLNTQQLQKIDGIIKNPFENRMPKWLANRRNDIETGQTRHLLTGELQFQTENDIKRMKMIKCYKGVRHALGQPVRGQRTRSNFRKNKGKVLGVVKSAGAKAGGRV